MAKNLDSLKSSLIKKAAKSLCRYRVSAIALDDRGEVLATAFNSPRFRKSHGGKHAEMAVLVKADVKKIKTIIIARVNKGGELLTIHPCKTCKRVLDRLGIKIRILR